MTMTLGRHPDAGRWLRRTPRGTLSALMLSVATVYGVSQLLFAYAWTPLQRAYLPTYLKTGMAGAMALGPKPFMLLQVTSADGPMPAMNSDVVVLDDGRLMLAAGRPGAGLAWTRTVVSPAGLYDVLRDGIYDGQSLSRLAIWPATAGLLMLMIGLVIGVPKDLARARERRQGRRLQGTEEATVAAFNKRWIGDDGIVIPQLDGTALRLPREFETSHYVLEGDTGVGKSTGFRHFLASIEWRGDSVIIYDPKAEFLREYFNAERGDVVLNALDARCPYWSPADEVQRPAEALTVAEALFPGRQKDTNTFFTDASRQIFAHVLTLPSDGGGKPSPHEIATWLSNDDELDLRLFGTPYAAMIDRKATAQRAGVLASLNMIAGTLLMLPTEAQGHGRFSAMEWAQQRRGWVFVTSSPETRARQLPLMALWLDMLMLRLMHDDSDEQRRTWIFIDELPSLKRLPQLPTAITQIRSSNVSLVLGFQSHADVKDLYGSAAESMLSQPATHFVFRTSDPDSAEHAAKKIGEVEVQRASARRGEGLLKRGEANYSQDWHRELLVMASEVQRLPNLHAIVKCLGVMVRVHFPYLSRPAVAPKFVARDEAPVRRMPASTSIDVVTLGQPG